jgi:hypothetical protein
MKISLRNMILAMLVATLFQGLAIAQPPPTQAPFLELFGQPLKSTTREQFRRAILKSGLRPDRLDGTYWMDFYKVDGSPEGATTFQAGYLAKDDTFAFAMYTFPGRTDKNLLANVTKLVTSKYGQPSSKSGDEHLGSVLLRWEMPQGMYIQASCGTSSEPICVAFIDNIAFEEMKAEITNERQKRQNRGKQHIQ